MMALWVAWLKRALMLVAALFGLAPASAQQAGGATIAPTPRVAPSAPASRRGPATWVIENGATKIYLFGTVHIFPAATQWRTPVLDRIILEADELVLETPDAASDQQDSERMMRPMRLGKSVPILNRVSPEARPALQAMIAASGMPTEMFDSMTTWGVGFMLTSMALRGGTDEAGQPVAMSGSEEVLSLAFRKRHRPIRGVETIEDQLNVFATMPLSAQRRFLETTVLGRPVDASDPAAQPMVAASSTAEAGGVGEGDAAARSDATEQAWLNGDLDGIAAEMNTMPREMYEPLLVRRNANWTRWLQARLQQPGTVLFAVGAGHLAGPDSVIAMLAARGITARRIN